MSYAEEAIYLAKVRLTWAEEGFRKSARKAAEVIKTTEDKEVIRAIANSLLLDKKVLDEAEEHYNYIMEHYGKEAEQNDKN